MSLQYEVSEWDSMILSLPVARITALPSGTYTQRRQAISSFVSAIREKGIEYLLCDLDADDFLSIGALQALFFQSLGTKVILRLELGRKYSRPRFPVRAACDDDLLCLKQIARESFKLDRMHADCTIPNEIADESRSAWIESSLNGMDDQVLVVSSDDDEPVGFITCKLNDEVGKIGLACVSRQLRSRGIGTALVEGAIRWFSDKVKRIEVSTYSRNIPALRMYMKVGFKPVHAIAVFRRRCW